MASWAEKWSNHRIWSGVERSRLLELHARRLAGDDLSPEIATHLRTAFEARVRTLSTTHFGLAAPVMNVHRLGVAADLVRTAMDEAQAALALALQARITPDSTGEENTTFVLLDFARGVSTDAVTYAAKPSRALVRVPLRLENDAALAPKLFRVDGSLHPGCSAHRCKSS
jgi:hypothetical protein